MRGGTVHPRKRHSRITSGNPDENKTTDQNRVKKLTITKLFNSKLINDPPPPLQTALVIIFDAFSRRFK